MNAKQIDCKFATRGSRFKVSVVPAHRMLLQANPAAAQWGWRELRRNPRVYARGRIRHPDRATITLPDWHRVVMNTETETDTMRNVAFID